MTDEQRKLYEEAALRHANYYSAKVHANFHELPYFQQEIFSHFIDGVRYCLETEVKELEEILENERIDSCKIVNQSSDHLDILAADLQNTRNQLRVAVSALELIERAYPLDGGRMAHQDCAREALQKIEAMKGNKCLLKK